MAGRARQRVVRGHVHQDGGDATAHDLVILEAELLEDRPDVLLDSPLREDERLGDRGVAPALGHLGEDLAFARRQLVERRAVALAIGGEQLLDDARVDRGAALGDDLDRGEELVPIVDALLEQVAAALGAVLEHGQRVGGAGVLAEDDDADLGVGLPQATRDPDPLFVAGGRHPDVGDDDVGWIGLDRGEERVPVTEGGDQVDRVDRADDLVQRLADQVGVIGEEDAQWP